MTGVEVTVEHHAENGAAPWVVVLRGGPFGEYWVGCRTRKAARVKAEQYRRGELEMRLIGDSDGC